MMMMMMMMMMMTHAGAGACIVHACHVRTSNRMQLYKAYDKLLTRHMSKNQGIGHDLTLVRVLNIGVSLSSREGT